MKWLRSVALLGLAASAAFFPAAPAWAQGGQIEIVAPPPEVAVPREVITPGPPPDVTRPREADFRPDNIRTRHDPAFITPLTTTTRTGPKTAVRIGFSGWTAPPGKVNAVVAREHSGLFALGISIVWGIPVEPEPAAPASPASPAPTR